MAYAPPNTSLLACILNSDSEKKRVFFSFDEIIRRTVRLNVNSAKKGKVATRSLPLYNICYDVTLFALSLITPSIDEILF